MPRRPTLLFFLLSAACSAPSSVEQVRVVLARSAPLPASVAAVQRAPRSTCVIVGDGERLSGAEDPPPFDLFTAADARAPALVVEGSSSVAIAWSELPRYPGSNHRARVALGGQRLVRFTGWASLSGRGFQIRLRAFDRTGHLWATGGSRAEVLGAAGKEIVLRVATGFAEPSRLEVTTGCANVAYHPFNLPVTHDVDAPSTGLVVENRAARIALADAPKGPAVASFVLPADTTLRLPVLEARSGWIRIAAEYQGIGFDGWVPGASMDQPMGIGLGGISTSSHCGGVSSSTNPPLRVTADTPLYTGAEPAPLEGAVVESGALVRFDGEQRGHLRSFHFETGEIAAPDGQHLWVDEQAVGR